MLRDWTDSLKFDGLSAEAERLFVRLIMKADDYGRYHAEPRLLKAGCFPLLETLRTNDLTRWLDELSTRQLVLCYESQGRSLLAIYNFGQRLKESRWKFPPPEGKEPHFLPTSDDFPEVPGSSGLKGREVEYEAGTRTGALAQGSFPSLDEVKAYAPTVTASPECAEAFWNAKEGDGWTNRNGHPLANWQPVFRNWAVNWKANEARNKRHEINGKERKPWKPPTGV